MGAEKDLLVKFWDIKDIEDTSEEDNRALNSSNLAFYKLLSSLILSKSKEVTVSLPKANDSLTRLLRTK